MAWAYTIGNFLWMTWDATHGTWFWLTRFSDIHFGVETRGNKTTLRISFLVWVKADDWLVIWWPICFVTQFSKQSYVYVGDTFQCIHRMYVVIVIMVSMLTNSNNMQTRHAQFLEFATVTQPFIQLVCEISSEPNLSQVYCLLDQESCVVSIKLMNNVSVCLSLCIFDGFA